MEFGGNGPSGSTSPSGLPVVVFESRNGVKAKRKQVPETVRQAAERCRSILLLTLLLHCSLCVGGWVFGLWVQKQGVFIH